MRRVLLVVVLIVAAAVLGLWRTNGGVRQGLRHDGGLIGKLRARKGTEKGVGKAAGNECVFIPGRRVGFDALLDAAGGEAVTGPLNRKR